MAYQGLEEDRKLILASADELGQYLASPVVLWPLHRKNQPLSPSNLLFAIKRHSVSLISPLPRDILEKIKQLIISNRAAWIRKVENELPLRLNQYRVIVDDYLDTGKIDAGYRNSISTRVKLELLMQELYPEPVKARREITDLDRKLFSLLEQYEFVWESELSSGFPKDSFGYLYVRGK